MPLPTEKPWRVLVVEDEPAIANVLCETLQRQGAIVYASPNGKAALHFLQTLRRQNRDLPDLVITDLRMPEMSGIELVQALQTHHIAIAKILAMSAAVERSDLLALMAAGITEFIEKPFSLKRFQEQIEKLRAAHFNQGWTDQRAQILEAENKQLRQRMRDWQAREAVSQITRGILHDMNNCLAIIQGSAEMIQLALEKGGKSVDGYATSITDISNRAVATLEQLQALNRLGEGLWTTFDMRKLIEGTHELVRTALGNQVTLQSHFGEDPLWVQGDAVQLQNAWIRLLFTARDQLSSPQGTLTVTGKLRCHRLSDETVEGFVAIRLTIPVPQSNHPQPNLALNSHRDLLQSQGCELLETKGEAGQSHWEVLLPAGALPTQTSHAALVESGYFQLPIT